MNLKLIIAGRAYSVNVTPLKAASMEKAAEMVNQQVIQFQSTYAISDPRDILAMCALQFAYQNIEHTETHTGAIEAKLAAIELVLDNANT